MIQIRDNSRAVGLTPILAILIALGLLAGAVLLVNASPEAESFATAETPDPVDSGPPSNADRGASGGPAAPSTGRVHAEPAERAPADIGPPVDDATEGSVPPSPTTTTTTTVAPVPFGSYTVEQVIDGTIGAGDGANPNEEAPMGLHEAPLYLPQAWSWAQGPTRNGAWGRLGTGSSRFAEFRCAVIPEFGHQPPVDFRVNFRNGSYYQHVNGTWEKAFDVQLEAGRHGAHMGRAGVLNSDPFASGRESIQWREEPDGSFSAPWQDDALMMHFWARQRQAPAPGQTAEFLTSEVRLIQPDGGSVDLNRVRVLFQCGIDYYTTTGGQGNKVPGPGIAKYHRATSEWRPSLWVTLPADVPAQSVADFRAWLEANPLPGASP